MGIAGGFGWRKIWALRTALPVAGALAGVFAAGDALAQSADCARLQAAIASAPHSGAGGQLQGAIERQRAELSRTSAYARSIGCDNQKFLFFGSDPPAQCGEIKGRISRMEASLADLQARSGGGGGRADLIARYNAECVNAPKQPSNIFEALFGGARAPTPFQPTTPASIPTSPEEQQQTIAKTIENEKKHANVSAGSYAVCVRACDGSFFPVSYSGSGSRADSLEDVCRSLCPNADVALYSFPFGGTIEQAVSSTGEPYVDMPNALKFQQSFDFDLLLPPQGRNLGAGSRRRRGQVRPRIARHSGDAGEVGGDVPADYHQGRRRRESKSSEVRRQGASHSSRHDGGRYSPRRDACGRSSARRNDAGRRRADAEYGRIGAEPRRQRRRYGAERGGGDHQPRGLGHRRRRLLGPAGRASVRTRGSP